MKKIIILLLVLLPIFASAADDKWMLVSPPESASHVALFVRKKITKPRGSEGYKVWVRWEYYSQAAKEHFHVTEFSKNAFCQQELYEITPDLQQLRILAIAIYDINGNVLENYNLTPSDSDWNYPNPESYWELVIEGVKQILEGKTNDAK